MADLKISALPASTTPLAGTETLPIVQSGSTKKVSVANLTAGRDVAVNKLQPTDNIEMASGKGIDFSANPAAPGVSSELLNDYETGTWTPTLTTTGTNFTSVTYNSLVGGKYTKVGNVVHVNGFMFTDGVTVGSASGTVCIGGLPFAVNTATSGKADANSAISISRASVWVTKNPIGIQAGSGSTNLELYYRDAVDGGTTGLAVANVGTGGTSNLLYFAGTYIAA